MALVAASLPIINILNIICSTGADTLSDDYLVHLRNIAPILNGSFSPGNFLHDSFYRGHLMVFPTLLRIILARLTYWNAYVELFIGVGAAILTLFLIHNALTAHSRHQVRLWMWPALSVLIFSVSQVDQFTYGDASIPIGFSALGISFALWSMVRFGRSWTAGFLAVAGAWLVIWSWDRAVHRPIDTVDRAGHLRQHVADAHPMSADYRAAADQCVFPAHLPVRYFMRGMMKAPARN